MARKAIVALSTKCVLATAARKQEMSVTETCGDRNSMKFICTDMEKCTALFAGKLGVQNTQSLQGSVGIHRSASTYIHRRMKDIQYRSYVH
eukprot:11079749-Ditylum_brightwellii.AAC.1